ncbi:MAG: hypothetical protein ABI867_36595 [Kofleriaceae bacterium]
MSPNEIKARLVLLDGQLRQDLAKLGLTRGEVEYALDPHVAVELRTQAVEDQVARFMHQPDALEHAAHDRQRAKLELVLAAQQASRHRRASMWVLGLASAVAIALATGVLVYVLI